MIESKKDEKRLIEYYHNLTPKEETMLDKGQMPPKKKCFIFEIKDSVIPSFEELSAKAEIICQIYDLIKKKNCWIYEELKFLNSLSKKLVKMLKYFH